MMNNNKIKVSVIIPVYRVEKYIERCARTLFMQTLKDIEYIFVDDCGNDNSINIIYETLKDYPERKDFVKIIKHKNNSGSFATRLTGINNAKGEYIIHCDSDDWVETDMYETLYDAAKNEEADVVWCDFIDEFSDKSNYRKEDCACNPEEFIKEILAGKRHGAVWNKLVKKELYTKNEIRPLTGVNVWEDLYMSVLILLHAKKISYINKGLYHYNQQNMGSLLSSLTMKKIEDRIKICNGLKTVLTDSNKYGTFEHEMKERCLIAKIELITFKDIRDLNLWRDLCPECNDTIFKSSFSFDNKIIQYLVKQKFDTAAIVLVCIKNKIKKLLHKDSYKSAA